MTPFISSRVRKLDVGISGYTDTDSVLNVTGKVSVGTAIDLVPYDSINNGTLRLEGSAGTLFSISNNLTSGSIFSVNDATGVPSLDVNANGTILLAPFGQTEYIGIGKVNPTEKVDVEGSIKLSGDIFITDNNEYSHNIQFVTPTKDREIVIPDATGTIGLVAGSTGNVQYNNAGKLAGSGDFNVQLDWATSTTAYTGLKLNATQTGGANSNANTNLLDLQVDGTSKFKINSNGEAVLSSNTYSVNPILRINSHNNNPIISVDHSGGVSNLSGCRIKSLSVDAISVGTAGINSSNFTENNAINFAGDFVLLKEASGTLAQRNSTNAQTYRLYNTYTDASNYQRTSINDDSTGLIINQEYAGTGELRTNLLDIQNNGTSKVVVTGSGNLRVGGAIDIVPYDNLNNGTLSFEGSAGQLFSITNNLTSGSIFAVNDVSGIPSLDIDADGTISIAEFSGNVFFAGLSTDTVFVGTNNNTNTNNSRLVVNGGISETVNGIQYPVVSQVDIGTDPNQIPLNQFLGSMAFADFPFLQTTTSTDGATASITVNAESTDLYSQIADYTTDVVYDILNLTSGREIKLYLRNTNASARTITIRASATNTGFANVNLAPGAGTMGAASTSTISLAATSGTTLIYVANIGGNIVGGILA